MRRPRLFTAILDGSKASFSRLTAIPFLASSWAIGTAWGTWQIVHGRDPLETVIVLAGIGGVQYAGGKALSIKKRQVEQEAAPSPDSQPDEAA